MYIYSNIYLHPFTYIFVNLDLCIYTYHYLFISIQYQANYFIRKSNKILFKINNKYLSYMIYTVNSI